jgi:protein TonB
MGNEGWGWAASLLAAAAMHAAIVAGVGLQAGRGAPMPQRLLAVEVALAAPLPEAPPAAPQAAPAPAAPADAPAAEPEATQHPAPSPAPVADAAATALPVALAPAPAPVPAPAHVKPRPLYDPAPQYPAVARRRGEQGTVRCLVTVDAAGRVETAAVLASSGSPALDRAALEAVTRTPFAPARAGEEAVRGELVVAVRFQLR